jgi:hypothetical protein
MTAGRTSELFGPGKPRVAEGAAHSVKLARPDLVLNAIDRVIAAARATA